MDIIDAAALAEARGTPRDQTRLERFRFLNEILVWHADGEESAIFPALEEVAPDVAEAYLADHRGLDAAYEALEGAIAAGDTLETARATAAFKFHLDLHLDKEDAHLYRLLRERLSVPDQGKAVGMMAGAMPQDRFPEVIGWMLPLVDVDDRETMMRTWQAVLPADVFGGITQLARQAVGEDWAELARRIPELGA
jgi:hypothetical protein